MRDKVVTIIKKHKLLTAFVIAALIKQLLVMGLPIHIVPDSTCDDQLLKDWAFSMSRLKWTGEFGTYTFMKETGFSFFMAVCYRLHLPFIFMITLGYSLSCMCFCTALKKIFSSNICTFIIYFVLLFNPVTFSSSVLQRVYRNGLGMVLTLFVFGGLLHMYFSVCDEKIKSLVCWSVFTGLSLGYLGITKSDTIWILPFTGVICTVMFGILLAKKRNFKSIPRYLCLTAPFAGIFLFAHIVGFCNILWYGYPSLEYYGPVIDNLTHIKSEQADDKIPLTREKLKEIYEISPTLAGVKGKLEKAMDRYSIYDTCPEDEEVEAGWFGWALAEGISDAGMYESCEKANTFYKNVYEELEAAFADGRLEKAETGIQQKYYIDTAVHRGEIVERIQDIITYMNTYKGAYTRGFTRKKWVGSNAEFELLTRNKATRKLEKYENDYIMKGWIVFPDHDVDTMEVYVEDQDGKQFAEVRLQESKDIYDYLKGTKYELDDVQKCRFKAEWDIGNENKSTEWYLSVYQDGESLVRIKADKEGFLEDEEIFYKGAVDTFIYREEQERSDAQRKRIVGRLNSIGDIYRVCGQPLFWLGLVSYVVLTAVVLKDLRKKIFRYGNAWLTATGLGLSVIVFAAGIALVDLTQCPVVDEMYLSSAYAVFISAKLISICKCAEAAIEIMQERKNNHIVKRYRNVKYL